MELKEKSIVDSIIESIEDYRDNIEENFKNNKDGDWYSIAINYGNYNLVEHAQGKRDDVLIKIERRIKDSDK
jgi:hypothetical protein